MLYSHFISALNCPRGKCLSYGLSIFMITLLSLTLLPLLRSGSLSVLTYNPAQVIIAYSLGLVQYISEPLYSVYDLSLSLIVSPIKYPIPLGGKKKRCKSSDKRDLSHL